ncbi:unnamed protein product [Caenorhabditis auriculariae]|uniref:Protein aurora borealis n=1 Tax=Caenorhabditis auriculariae TaxID=2777116 RepID=A0A8S1HE59_9PELO|nr:unnamed protein product [Caenorhabditis auriculariae]
MDENQSLLIDGDEENRFQNPLNSTVVDTDLSGCNADQPKEWKLSPIMAEKEGEKEEEDGLFQKPIFSRSMKRFQMRNPSPLTIAPVTPSRLTFRSPFKDSNQKEYGSSYDKSVESKENSAVDLKNSMVGHFSTPKSDSKNCSSISKINISTISPLEISNKSLNPFDSFLLTSIHKSTNFSPSVVFNSVHHEEHDEAAGTSFKWTVEQMAMLKPANITDEEIAASYNSPNPEVERKLQKLVDKYWKSKPTRMLSPDVQRSQEVSNGVLKASSSHKSHNESGFCNAVRTSQAIKAAYCTSSPKQRPRRSIKRARNVNIQTDITIPPSSEIDLKKILGEAFVYRQNDEEEEDFDVSMCSNYSTRRRLFPGVLDGSSNEEENSFMSVDPNESTSSSQNFEEGISPVEFSEVSNSISSIIAQITTNDEVSVEVPAKNALNEANDRSLHRQPGTPTQEFDEAEFQPGSVLRREDLDFTPRRDAARSGDLRRFLLELSPIDFNVERFPCETRFKTFTFPS